MRSKTQTSGAKLTTSQCRKPTTNRLMSTPDWRKPTNSASSSSRRLSRGWLKIYRGRSKRKTIWLTSLPTRAKASEKWCFQDKHTSMRLATAAPLTWFKCKLKAHMHSVAVKGRWTKNQLSNCTIVEQSLLQAMDMASARLQHPPVVRVSCF